MKIPNKNRKASNIPVENKMLKTVTKTTRANTAKDLWLYSLQISCTREAPTPEIGITWGDGQGLLIHRAYVREEKKCWRRYKTPTLEEADLVVRDEISFLLRSWVEDKPKMLNVDERDGCVLPENVGQPRRGLCRVVRWRCSAFVGWNDTKLFNPVKKKIHSLSLIILQHPELCKSVCVAFLSEHAE